MRSNIVLILLVVTTIVSGCDFFRSLAGRPTSKDIELKRREILKQKAELEKAKQDSITLAQKAEADSLVAVEAISQWIYPTSDMGGLTKDMNLSHKYYVIIGAYRVKANAERVLEQVSQAGYHVELIGFQNYLYAIGLSPSNKIAEIHASYLKITKEPFCPKGAWILLNE